MAKDFINTLYYGDNLDILRRYIPNESVDLVYLDPPFNSNADYNVLFTEVAHVESVKIDRLAKSSIIRSGAQIKAFEDTWTWNIEAARNFTDAVQNGGSKLAQGLLVLRSFLGQSNMLAYLAMMAPRLVELRRVMKTTASIYLHCDPTASHYLKMLMDAVFEPQNYVNEIIWKRQSSHNDAKQGSKHFGRIHDVLLFYRRSYDATFNHQYRPYDDEYVEGFYKYAEPGTGRQYRLSDITAPGGASEAKRNPHYEFLGVTRYWRYSRENMQKLFDQGRIIQTKPGTVPQYKRYLDEGMGVPVGTVWDDVDSLQATHAERLGYPTQKPVSLLERIISASSDEGDIVLDPFCGCGTTVAAAQKLKRRWIGIDVTHLAVNLIKVRLNDSFGKKIAGTYKVVGEPEDIEGARELANRDKYQFQYWALGLIGARPAASQEKKGADKGIDGRLYITDAGGDVRSIVISVKGGHAAVPHIRDLRGVIEREDAAIGVFICIEPPTKPMFAEAADAGFYENKSGVGKSRHPRIQILTIEDLLSGKRLDLPLQQDLRSFKQAPKSKPKKSAKTATLDFDGNGA